jgi:hypothetical protein
MNVGMGMQKRRAYLAYVLTVMLASLTISAEKAYGCTPHGCYPPYPEDGCGECCYSQTDQIYHDSNCQDCGVGRCYCLNGYPWWQDCTIDCFWSMFEECYFCTPPDCPY